VDALARVGRTLYVGGDFLQLGGQPRWRLAALDLDSHSVGAWNPGAIGLVRALVSDGVMVYAGGMFSRVAGVARSGLAAVDAGSGAVSDWDPSPNGSVNALAINGTTIYAAGDFTTMQGSSQPNFAAFTSPTAGVTGQSPATGRLAFAPPAPTPARNRSQLRFTLPAAGPVSLEVFDLAGRRIAAPLGGGRRPAGANEVELSVRGWAAGVYLCRLTYHGERASERIVVLP
jgi:hypothetical protein